MAQVHVVAAAINRSSKFLLGKRAAHKTAAGFWSPISGEIEKGETEAQAVVRECFEEIGLKVKAVRKLKDFDIDNGKSRLHWWLVEELEGKEFVKNDEHSALKWFSIDEIKKEKNMFPETKEILLALAKAS